MLKIYRANITLSPLYEESSTLFEAFFTSEPEARQTLSAAICSVEAEYSVDFNDDGDAESAVGWFYAGVDTVEVFDSSSEHVLAQEEKHRVYPTSLKALLKPSFYTL